MKTRRVAEIFSDPRGTKSLAASKAWSAGDCDNIMCRCDSYLGTIPRNAPKSWLKTKAFTVPFKYWTHPLEQRRDIPDR